MKFAKASLLIPLLAMSFCAHAASSDYTVIKKGPITLALITKWLAGFDLKSDAYLTGDEANSAVLQLEITGSNFKFNEVYINPPTTVCTPDASDANQEKTIGFLPYHNDPMLSTEWAMHQIVFKSYLLKPGANQLMVCLRDVNGNVASGFDSIQLRNVVLHYRRSNTIP